MSLLKQHRQLGFTLLELILYLALVGSVLTAITGFGWKVILADTKNNTQHELNHALQFASERISLEIREASGIVSVSPSSLTLQSSVSSRNPIVIRLSSGRIQIGQGTTGACTSTSLCPLTPANVSIDTLSFTNLSYGDSKNVQFSITGSMQGDLSEFKAEQTVTSSSELRAE